jgi:hypothetical protein
LYFRRKIYPITKTLENKNTGKKTIPEIQPQNHNHFCCAYACSFIYVRYQHIIFTEILNIKFKSNAFLIKRTTFSQVPVAYISVTLTTWESVLGRLLFTANPGKHFGKPHLNQQQGAVASACHPKLCRGLKLEGLRFQASPGKKMFIRPSLNRKKPECGGMCLSSQRQQKV